jgi:hypothetical protein
VYCRRRLVQSIRSLCIWSETCEIRVNGSVVRLFIEKKASHIYHLKKPQYSVRTKQPKKGFIIPWVARFWEHILVRDLRNAVHDTSLCHNFVRYQTGSYIASSRCLKLGCLDRQAAFDWPWQWFFAGHPAKYFGSGESCGRLESKLGHQEGHPGGRNLDPVIASK